jgi:hypothetical protein
LAKDKLVAAYQIRNKQARTQACGRHARRRPPRHAQGRARTSWPRWQVR